MALSQIHYISSCIKVPNDIVKQITKVIYTFIWKVSDKIKIIQAAKPYDQGGLKLFEIENIIAAITLHYTDIFDSKRRNME